MLNYYFAGQVYLVGCTNAGKSTLFNALLSSDYCKSIARDFMYRATVSQWPGKWYNDQKCEEKKMNSRVVHQVLL